jgi:hypothetical protein
MTLFTESMQNFPMTRHCERSEAIQCTVESGGAAGLLRRCVPRNDDGRF